MKNNFSIKNNLFQHSEIYWVFLFIFLWLFPRPIIFLEANIFELLDKLWVFEFILGHSGVAFLFVNALKKTKLHYPALILFFSFYGIFLYAMIVSIAFIPGLLYVLTLIDRSFDLKQWIKKLFKIKNNEKVVVDNSMELISSFGKVMLLILSLGLGLVIPWPELGLTEFNIIRVENSLDGNLHNLCMGYILYFSGIIFFRHKFSGKLKR